MLRWQDIRDDDTNINAELARIVDTINPDQTHWLVKTTYPYGAPTLNKSRLMLPNAQGRILELMDATIDKELQEALSYGGTDKVVGVAKMALQAILRCFNIGIA